MWSPDDYRSRGRRDFWFNFFGYRYGWKGPVEIQRRIICFLPSTSPYINLSPCLLKTNSALSARWHSFEHKSPIYMRTCMLLRYENYVTYTHSRGPWQRIWYSNYAMGWTSGDRTSVKRDFPHQSRLVLRLIQPPM